MIKRIALMGAGSLGTILGAFLAEKNYDIVLVDANKAHVDALNTNGAHVTGSVDVTIPVKAITPDEMTGSYDLFIYMAKQTFNDTAIPQMLAHSHADTVFATCQNGLPEVALTQYIPERQIMGVPIGWAAIFKGPGCSFLASDRDFMSVTLGTYTGEHTPQVDEVADVLRSACKVTVSDNLMGLRWSKLIVNAAFSGLSTITGWSLGDVSQDPALMRICCFIARECLRVANASGVKVEHYHVADQSFNFTKMFDFEGEPDVPAAMADASHYLGGAKRAMASMLQDLQRGHKCEVDAICGIVCDIGDKHGVDTPVIDQVTRIIHRLEDGELKIGRETADLIQA